MKLQFDPGKGSHRNKYRSEESAAAAPRLVAWDSASQVRFRAGVGTSAPVLREGRPDLGKPATPTLDRRDQLQGDVEQAHEDLRKMGDPHLLERKGSWLFGKKPTPEGERLRAEYREKKERLGIAERRVKDFRDDPRNRALMDKERKSLEAYERRLADARPPSPISVAPEAGPSRQPMVRAVVPDALPQPERAAAASTTAKLHHPRSVGVETSRGVLQEGIPERRLPDLESAATEGPLDAARTRYQAARLHRDAMHGGQGPGALSMQGRQAQRELREAAKALEQAERSVMRRPISASTASTPSTAPEPDEAYNLWRPPVRRAE